MADMKYTSYAELKGADFSDDPSRISRSRSPNTLNMISDNGGNPVKRKGWEYIADTSDVHTSLLPCLEFTDIHSFGGSVMCEYLTDTGKTRLAKIGETAGARTVTRVNASFAGKPKIIHNDYLYAYDLHDTLGTSPGLSYLRVNPDASSSTAKTVPTVLIATDPETGGGTSYESVNLLSGDRTYSYTWGGQHGMNGHGTGGTIQSKTCAELDAITAPYTEGDVYRITGASGTAKGQTWNQGDLAVCTFTLAEGGTAEDSHWMKVTRDLRVVVGSDQTILGAPGVSAAIRVYRLCKDGSWVRTYDFTLSAKAVENGISYYTVTLTDTARIGETTGVSYPVVTGTDNIKITFCIDGANHVPWSDMYSWCVFEDRVFIGTGFSSGEKRIYYSEAGDPSYIADTNYISCDGTPYVLAVISNAIAVVKKEPSKTTDFITSTTLTDTITDVSGNSTTRERTVYRITHGLTGFGAVTSSHAYLSGEPLFLTNNGIFGVVTGSDSDSKYIKSRSHFVDRKLTKESGLSEAAAVSYKGYFILSAGEHCYVLDSRQKTRNANGSAYVYECYYWDGIDAIAFAVQNTDEHLWFIRDDGEHTYICRFKENDESEDYSDGTDRYDSTVEGTAINAYFATMFDNDGTTALYKTLQKKGTGCTVVPYNRSSVTAYLNKDNTEDVFIGTTDVSEINYENLQFYRFSADVEVGGIQIGPFYADRLDFNDIDFARFAFTNSELTRDFYFRKKLKKYKRVQIKLANNVINEPFGILEIFKTYTIGNYAKR